MFVFLKVFDHFALCFKINMFCLTGVVFVCDVIFEFHEMVGPVGLEPTTCRL